METFVSPLFRSKVVQTAVLQSDGGWVVGRGVWRVEGGWRKVEGCWQKSHPLNCLRLPYLLLGKVFIWHNHISDASKMSLMWLLATIHLHWLKDATLFWWIWLHLVLKTSLTTVYLIFFFASVLECDTSPGPETHVEYIDLCNYIFQILACLAAFLAISFCHRTRQRQVRADL